MLTDNVKIIRFNGLWRVELCMKAKHSFLVRLDFSNSPFSPSIFLDVSVVTVPFVKFVMVRPEDYKDMKDLLDIYSSLSAADKISYSFRLYRVLPSEGVSKARAQRIHFMGGHGEMEVYMEVRNEYIR